MKKILAVIAGTLLASSSWAATSFVNDPSMVIAGTTYNFDVNSSAEGICKAMGFKDYVAGSLVSRLDGMLAIAYVDARGTVKGYEPNAGVTEVVTMIGCEGEGSATPIEGEMITSPSMSVNGVSYSFDEHSNLDGVCKALGFSSAVEGSAYYDTAAFPNIAYVRFNGEVFRLLENLSTAVVLKQVACE